MDGSGEQLASGTMASENRTTGKVKKKAGRPVGSKSTKPLKTQGPRVYTAEQLKRKVEQRKIHRAVRRKLEQDVKNIINNGSTQVISTAVVVPNMPTDEKVTYLERSFGCSSDIRAEMSSGSITTVYVAARVFESMHIKAGRKKSSLIRKFSDFLKSQSMLMCNGALVRELEKQFHQKLRTNVWHPARISELQDSMMSSCINMHTLDALSALTKSAKINGTKHYIPSRSTVSRYNRLLENSMRVLVNSRINRTGTRVLLVLKDLITQMILHSPLLIKRGCSQHELDQGQRPAPIYLAATVDGAKLTEASGMIISALKIVDGELLRWLHAAREKDKIGCITTDDLSSIAELPSHVDVQSCRNIIMCGWMEGNDSAENNFKVCASLFKTLERWSCGDNLFYVDKLDLHFKLSVVFPCDLKAIQQNIGYGGGTHVCRQFCVYCGVKNYDRAVPSLIACEHCRGLNKPEGYCYHSVFLTSEMIAIYGALTDPKRLRRRFCFPVGWTQYNLTQCRSFAVNICLENPDYIKDMKLPELKNHLRQVESVSVVNYNTIKLLDEVKCNKLLRLLGCEEDDFDDCVREAAELDCGISQHQRGSVEQKRHLIRYLQYDGMIIDACKERTKLIGHHAITTPENCVLCTLHMMLRVGELLMTRLVRCVLHIRATFRSVQLQKISGFFIDCFSGLNAGESIEEIHSFHVGYDAQKNTVEPIKMSGARQKKVLQRIGELISLVFSAEYAANISEAAPSLTIESFTSIFRQYQLILDLLCIMDHYAWDEIDEVQNVIDNFGREFIGMFGGEAVTNYVHALISGHVRFWLRIHGNIHKFNNSGLESYVGVVRSYFFKRTQRGGSLKTNISVCLDKGLMLEDGDDTEISAEEPVALRSEISVAGGGITEAGHAESRVMTSRNTAYNLERYMQRQVCRMISYFTDNAEQWRHEMYERAKQKGKQREGNTAIHQTATVTNIEPETIMRHSEESVDENYNFHLDDFADIEDVEPDMFGLNGVEERKESDVVNLGNDDIDQISVIMQCDNIVDDFFEDESDFLSLFGFDNVADDDIAGETVADISFGDDDIDIATVEGLLSYVDTVDHSNSISTLTRGSELLSPINGSPSRRNDIARLDSRDEGDICDDLDAEAEEMSTTYPGLDVSGIVGYTGLTFIGGMRYYLEAVENKLSCSQLAELRFECVDEICQNIPICCNRRIQRRQCPTVEIFLRVGSGHGLKCKERGGIAAGTYIGEYCGKVIDHKMFKKMVAQQVRAGQSNGILLELDLYQDSGKVSAQTLYIDPSEAGNLTRYLNHNKCDPNCRIEKWYVEGLPRIGIFSTKLIPFNKVLSVCYNVADSRLSALLKCSCGSKKCPDPK